MKASKLAVSALSALALMVAAGSAMAADPVTPIDVNGGTIHFTGKVTNGACTVSPESDGQTVDLGSMKAKDVVIGKAGKFSDFDITLEDCSLETYSNAAFIFSGQPDEDDNSVLANNYGPGAATGVGIQLKDLDGKVVALNATGANMKLIAGTNVAKFSAALFGTQATAVSGNVDATATFKVHYE